MSLCVCVSECVCVCLCVCVKKGVKETDRERERVSESQKEKRTEKQIEKHSEVCDMGKNKGTSPPVSVLPQTYTQPLPTNTSTLWNLAPGPGGVLAVSSDLQQMLPSFVAALPSGEAPL